MKEEFEKAQKSSGFASALAGGGGGGAGGFDLAGMLAGAPSNDQGARTEAVEEAPKAKGKRRG